MPLFLGDLTWNDPCLTFVFVVHYGNVSVGICGKKWNWFHSVVTDKYIGFNTDQIIVNVHFVSFQEDPLAGQRMWAREIQRRRAVSLVVISRTRIAFLKKVRTNKQKLANIPTNQPTNKTNTKANKFRNVHWLYQLCLQFLFIFMNIWKHKN